MTRMNAIYPGPIATTGVGSMPVANPFDSLESMVTAAVRTQLEAGILVVSTGQVSMYNKNMIDPFLETMTGLVVEKIFGREVPTIEGRKKIKPKSVSEINTCTAIEEIKVARRELDLWAEENSSSKPVLLKGAITGPNTILHEIPGFRLGRYNDRYELLTDLSEVVLVVIQAMIKAGADTIQIDEPVLSRYPYDDTVKRSVKALEQISTGINVEHGVGIHICGEISPELWVDLSRLKGVHILDFEYHLYPANFKTIDPQTLEIAEHYDTPKNISVGVVSSIDSRIEYVEDIKKLIKKAIRQYGSDRVCFDPDCGLRSFTPGEAKAKLEALCQAVNEVIREDNLA